MLVFIGIGQGRVTNNVKGAPVDYAIMVSDDESVSMVWYYVCSLLVTSYTQRENKLKSCSLH